MLGLSCICFLTLGMASCGSMLSSFLSLSMISWMMSPRFRVASDELQGRCNYKVPVPNIGKNRHEIRQLAASDGWVVFSTRLATRNS